MSDQANKETKADLNLIRDAEYFTASYKGEVLAFDGEALVETGIEIAPVQLLNGYAELTKRCANYPFATSVDGIVYCALGLVGEAGEVSEKIKKLWRNGTLTLDNPLMRSRLREDLTEQDRAEIVKELGDVLWYLARLADHIGASLAEVAAVNIAKLTSRQDRGVILGEGDDR